MLIEFGASRIQVAPGVDRSTLASVVEVFARRAVDPARCRGCSSRSTLSTRVGFNRLAAVVTQRLGLEARSGALFVVFSPSGAGPSRYLFFDGRGICQFFRAKSARSATCLTAST
jgi:hypothetical protein